MKNTQQRTNAIKKILQTIGHVINTDEIENISFNSQWQAHLQSEDGNWEVDKQYSFYIYPPFTFGITAMGSDEVNQVLSEYKLLRLKKKTDKLCIIVQDIEDASKIEKIEKEHNVKFIVENELLSLSKQILQVFSKKEVSVKQGLKEKMEENELLHDEIEGQLNEFFDFK